MERYFPRQPEQTEFGRIKQQVADALLSLVIIQYLAANRDSKPKLLDQGVTLVSSLAPTGEFTPTPPTETPNS